MATGHEHDIQERTFGFAQRVVAICQRLQTRDLVIRRLALQLLHAGTSIGANLEEADAAQSKPDFVSKCAVARKEAYETQYWLRLIAAADPTMAPEVTPLLMEATELRKILTAITKHASASRARGKH